MEMVALLGLHPERFAPWAREVLAEHIGMVTGAWQEMDVIHDYEFVEPLSSISRSTPVAIMDGVPQTGLLMQV